MSKIKSTLALPASQLILGRLLLRILAVVHLVLVNRRRLAPLLGNVLEQRRLAPVTSVLGQDCSLMGGGGVGEERLKGVGQQ